MKTLNGTRAALRVAAVLLLALVLCGYATASFEDLVDCCLSTRNKAIPFRLVQTYSIQSVASGCPIPATVFITKKYLRLCAPPANKSKWVAKLIRRLDSKQKPKKKKAKRIRRTQRAIAALQGQGVPGL